MDTKIIDNKQLLSSGALTALGAGFNLRNTKWADLNAVAQLIYDICEADGDTTVAVTPEELKVNWQNPGFNVETDTWVVETKDGRIVGYEEFSNGHAHAALYADGYVHPDFRGNGIETTLLRVIEERARKEMTLAEPDLRVVLQSSLDSHDEVGRSIHAAEGYHVVRCFWRMEIALQEPPPAPIWPEGVELRPFNMDRDARAVWEAHQESFRDHWGSHFTPFEEWKHHRFGLEDFDPSLWVVAWDGDQIAGFSQNRYRMGIGWIGTLGVLRPWRKHGLGLALLLYSFGVFYQRDMKTIGLGVDASSPTGATRLYQKAGMRVASEFVTYEKELRAGREPEGEE
ncbi:MAG: GNAT family N-acetyltransferase [Anaerolineales bacterium]|nr:GNAT family N-acetyltransferase [Anaerolineales bacterium]